MCSCAHIHHDGLRCPYPAQRAGFCLTHYGWRPTGRFLQFPLYDGYLAVASVPDPPPHAEDPFAPEGASR